MQCVLERRLRLLHVDAAKGETVSQTATPDKPTGTVWYRSIPAPGGGMTLPRLYSEASKAFNWVKKQPSAMTQKSGSLIVAAFYDDKTKSMYLSTILRGKHLVSINAGGGQNLGSSLVKSAKEG